MRYRLSLGFAFACVAGMAGAQGVSVGDRAPSFTVNDTTGRPMLLGDLRNSSSGPLFLYFINDRDGVSRQASSYIDRMVRAYGTMRSRWYGIINAREDRTRAYQAEFNPPYHLLLDKNMTTVQQYGVANAPAVIEIDRNGRVARVWKGLSANMLKDLNREIARVNGKRVKSLAFIRRAPSVTQYGTAFIGGRANGG